MSRDSNERGPVSQRYQYETLPIPHAFPLPPLPKPYHATWQYPPTPPFPPSIFPLTASTAIPGGLSPFTIHNFPSPSCHKYLNSNVNVKSIEAVWVTPSIPASTSTYDDQAQRDIAVANVKTSPSSAGFSIDRDEDIDERDMDTVKGKRAPQITSESVLSSAETASNGSPPSLSHSSPTSESVTGSPTSLVSSSILTLTTVPVPGRPSTPPTFTSTSTTITTTTAFPLTSAPASPSTPANGLTSPKPTSTTSPTTGTTTTISNSPDPRSLSTSTTMSRAMPFKSSATSIPASIPTIGFPTTSPFTTSISGLPTSLTSTTLPSASIPFSSITTSDSATVTDITSFTSSSSDFTSSVITMPSSSISPSSPDSDSTSFKSSKSPSWLTQSSTYTRPSMIFSSSITEVWSTTTLTNVYTSALPDGGMTVVTTVVKSGVLSTNTSLSGDRFSRNTGAVIAVAVCATVGVIIFVFVVFFLCKRYRERKERQKRRKSRRPGLHLPAAPVSGRPGTGNSGGSGRVGDSRANILATGYGREWSRSRSGEAVMEGGEAGPSEDGEDEEDVWRSPLVGEDDDVGMGMGGLTTPPESEGRPVGGRKSSIGHQSAHSHSLGHSLTHSQGSSGDHGQGQGVPPSMAEFGMGPVSYAAYAYPPVLVGYPAYHSGVVAGGGGAEASGAPSGGEGQSGGLDSHGSRASYGAFVPYPSPVAVSGVGTGCNVLPTTNVVETKDKPGQRPGSSRRESEGEASSAAGGHAAAGASGLVSTPTTGTSGSRGTSGSKGSLRSIGSKNLRGFMDRIRTSVPNIQVTDGMLPTRRSSKDMSSPPSASGSGGERPGYDYGVVGRPRLVSGGVHAPPPVAFAYPVFHTTPPGAPGADVPSDLPCNPQVDISNHYHGPILYGYPVPAVNGEGEGGVYEDEDDSLRITNGVVTDGLLDPNLSLIGGGGGDGGSFGGRSSPNVEGASLRDYVDYSRRIGGMVKNHVTRSTTTFDTVDQDGSIHFFVTGGGPPTPG